MKYSKMGFTLIEVLVVIAVIGALSTAGFLGVQNTLVSQRDRARLENVRAISGALENYYSDNGEYPLGSELNPSNAVTELSSMSTVTALLTDVTNDNLTGPQSAKFFPYCSFLTTATPVAGPCPATDDASNWTNYHANQYIYISSYAAATDPQTTSIDTVTYGSLAWGCQITRYYDSDQTNGSDQGYALAYRRESDGIWQFFKSRRGTVTISNTASGTHPSPCVFSKL